MQSTYPELLIASTYLQISLEIFTGSFMKWAEASAVYAVCKEVKRSGSVTSENRAYIVNSFAYSSPELRDYLINLHPDFTPRDDVSAEALAIDQLFAPDLQYPIDTKLEKALREAEAEAGLTDTMSFITKEFGQFERILFRE